MWFFFLIVHIISFFKKNDCTSIFHIHEVISNPSNVYFTVSYGGLVLASWSSREPSSLGVRRVCPDRVAALMLLLLSPELLGANSTPAL